jgi:hypothetical protein
MITPEDINRLYKAPAESKEQLEARRQQIMREVISAPDPLDPKIVSLTEERMLLSAYLDLTNVQVEEIRESVDLLDADLLSQVLAGPQASRRFTRTEQDILLLPSSSSFKYSHAQCNLSVFGLRKPDDAGNVIKSTPNLLLISGGSTSAGIKPENPQRPFTISLISDIGKTINPRFEVEAI